MANTAFWLGAMRGMHAHYPDIRKFMSFADVGDNFGKASRFGLDTSFSWTKDQKISVKDLVLEELLPMSREGLESMNVDRDDIDRYLSVIQERMEAQMTGARWMLRSFTKLKDEAASTDEALTCLTASIYNQQNRSEFPVHKWKDPDHLSLKASETAEMRVSEIMQTELFTAQKKDLVALVAKLMSWKNISHMPVEDKKGNLVGLINASSIVDHLMDEQKKKKSKPAILLVRHVMQEKPVTVGPNASLKDATSLMRHHGVSCLPVVKGKELLGIITEHDIVQVTNRILN